MPFVAHTCIVAKCDICGHVYDHEDCTEEHFDSASAAREQIVDDQWTVTLDNRVICPADDCRNAA